jgi:hypothetical protein
MSTIRVNLAILQNTIRYELQTSKQLKKYFLQDQMYVRYNDSLNINNIPVSILTIPIVSIVAPITWAVGADLQVSELDTAYLESLNKTKNIFRSLEYPFDFRGEFKVERPVENRVNGNRICLLLSNGVDSLTSYFKQKKKNRI